MNKIRYFLTAAFALGTNDYAVTALADDDSFALSYLPTRCTRTIDLSKLSGERVIASWFNPRTGETTRLGELTGKKRRAFEPPARVTGCWCWMMQRRIFRIQERSI